MGQCSISYVLINCVGLGFACGHGSGDDGADEDEAGIRWRRAISKLGAVVTVLLDG